MRAAALALLCCALAIPAEAQQAGPTTTRFYDRQGRPAGTAVRQGDTTRFYDRTGRPAGTAKTTTRPGDRARASKGN